MSQDEFRRHFQLAKSLMEGWPSWKKNLLEDSSKPTVAVPRSPIYRQSPKSTGMTEIIRERWSEIGDWLGGRSTHPFGTAEAHASQLAKWYYEDILTLRHEIRRLKEEGVVKQHPCG